MAFEPRHPSRSQMTSSPSLQERADDPTVQWSASITNPTRSVALPSITISYTSLPSLAIPTDDEPTRHTRITISSNTVYVIAIVGTTALILLLVYLVYRNKSTFRCCKRKPKKTVEIGKPVKQGLGYSPSLDYQGATFAVDAKKGWPWGFVEIGKGRGLTSEESGSARALLERSIVVSATQSTIPLPMPVSTRAATSAADPHLPHRLDLQRI